MSITAISAWLLVAVYYFYQYALRSAPRGNIQFGSALLSFRAGLTTWRRSTGMVEFAASLGNVERVDVLPFHQMGRFKWEKLGMDYQMREAKPPSRETVNEVLSRFRAAGLKAV